MIPCTLAVLGVRSGKRAAVFFSGLLSFFLTPAFLFLQERCRVRSSKSRVAGRVARPAEDSDSSSSVVERDSVRISGSPSMEGQQPTDDRSQLQGQLIRTLQDALDEIRAVHRMSEEARQVERQQLQERIQELTEREERRTEEIRLSEVKVAE
ncbi:hypothetical protein CSUI_007699, partial [Cystoisospora suis]